MPECYGWFDDWDGYCWDFCPYSCSCERATFGYCSTPSYYDDYWWDEYWF